MNNSDYSGEKDNGFYLTGIDYTYSNVPDLGNEFNYSLGLSSVSMSFAVLSLFFPTSKLLIGGSTLISAISFVSEIVENSCENTQVTINDKTLSGVPYYNIKQHQLDYYHELIKTGGIVINSTEDTRVWFNTGATASAHFKVSHDGTQDLRTRLSATIGLKVVDKDDVVQSEHTSVNEYTFGTESSEPIRVETASNAYLLPKGINNFHFDSIYSGKYVLRINTNSDFTLFLNDEPIQKTNQTSNYCEFEVNFKHNTSNKIKIINNDGVWCAPISITPSNELTGIKIGAGDSYIIKLPVDEGLKHISVKSKDSSKDVSIERILKLSDGVFVDSYLPVINPVDACDVILRGENYLIIKNNGSTEKIADITCSDVPVLNLGTAMNANISADNYTYFKFSADNSELQNYALTATNADNMQFKLIKAEDMREQIMINNFSYGYSAFGLLPGKTYYIGIKNGTNVSSTIKIQKENTAYQWRIGNVTTSESSIEVARGKVYDIRLLINGQVSTGALRMINQMAKDENIYQCYFNNSTSKLDVKSICQVGGNGVIIQAADFGYGGSNFDPLLMIVPAFDKSTITMGASYNNEALGFEFVYQAYMDSLTYQIAFTDGTSVSRNYKFALGLANNAKVNIDILGNYELKSRLADVKLLSATAKHNSGVYQINSASRQFDMYYGGGEGTEESYFKISCVRHFNNIDKTSKKDSDFYYQQTVDLDFNNQPTARNVVFYGTYHGGGKKIKNIKIENESKIIGGTPIGGMFDENYGAIRYVNIENINMSFGSKEWIAIHAGAVAGRNRPGGIMAVINISGKIVNQRNYDGTTGGATGINEGDMLLVFSTLYISAYGDTGGIAGVNKRGAIQLCGFNGELYYFQKIGAMNKSAGGIAGYNIGQIRNCTGSGKIKYANSISSDSLSLLPYIGQVVGFNGREGDSVGICESCTGDAKVDKGKLQDVEYYKFPKKRNHCQYTYCGERLVGRQA